MITRVSTVLLAALMAVRLPSMAQVVRPDTGGIPRFPIENSPTSVTGPARSWAYLADLGRRAAALGDETGSFEIWTWPLKVVRDFRLAFRTEQYDQPISHAMVARQVTVRPEGATVTFAHASFTVKQHVFVPLNEPGVIILLDVSTIRPLDIVVQMHADFNLAWPGSFGGANISWQNAERRFLLTQGGVRQYNAFAGSPLAASGTAHPAHDAPTFPSQFVIRVDSTPRHYIPIVIVGGALPRDSAHAVYDRLLRSAESLWREKVLHYRQLRQNALTVESPDARLNQAFEWAKVNLEQQLVCNPDLGCGQVAGFGRAGPGNFRPGFGWYFGGDAAINSFASTAVGQTQLVREGLAFLARFQRADGKIPHEISHAAARLPWFTEYPYTWFHGDTTPFWILACYNYWSATADAQFLKQYWPNIVRAFRWSAATDTDGDGLMENPSAGAGAIEVGGLGEELWTDIYLAGVWAAALQGLRSMAEAAADAVMANEAKTLLSRAHETLEQKFWLEQFGSYAFALLRARPDSAARGREPRVNDALTVWPATAMAFGVLDEQRSSRMLKEISSAALTTDWGTRMLSRFHRLYDPLHYNNGTVWPFVTGFAALAHYRHHRGWSGHELVRAVALATFDFARGRTPELLSGAYYNVLDSSVPQQFFASSMLVTPVVRGLLGVEVDAPNRAVAIEPHLPAEWSTLTANDISVGRDRLHLTIRRAGGNYHIALRRTTPGQPLYVRLSPALPLGSVVQRVRVDDRDVPVQTESSAHDTHAVVELQLTGSTEAEIDYTGGLEVQAPAQRLEVGDPADGLRVLDFRRDRRDFVLLVEGVPGRSYAVTVRGESRVRSVTGAELAEQDSDRATLRIRFGPAAAPVARREIRIRT